MANFTLEVPNSASITRARGFLPSIQWPLERDAEVQLRFHERWCHMQPWFLSALAAWALATQRFGVRISGFQNTYRAQWAWRFGLMDFIPGWEFEAPPVTPHEESGRFIPLKQVRTSDALEELIANIAPLLHLANEPQQAKAVQYAMSEMVRNVLEHSNSPDGAIVSAQFYPGVTGSPRPRPYVSVGIADCGIGILRSLVRNYPALTNPGDAVLTAIQRGTTGAGAASADNAGGGLFITRRLSQVTGGYFGVISSSALFRSSLAQNPAPDDQLLFEIASFPGTVVSVEIGLSERLDITQFMADTRTTFLDAATQSSQRAARMVIFK